jgi:hypothetical protein
VRRGNRKIEESEADVDRLTAESEVDENYASVESITETERR